MNTLLSQEVCNRFFQLPESQRGDGITTLMRITVEVTRELERRSPGSVDEFLRMTRAQPGSTQ